MVRLDAHFNSQAYTQLVLFAGQAEEAGEVCLVDTVSGQATTVSVPSAYVWHHFFPLHPQRDYRLTATNVHLPFLYLCGAPDTLTNGVRYLTPEGDRLLSFDSRNMGDYYRQPFRNRFHFSAFRNWMNDPNGLCYDRGRYHLFYQMNPAALQWGPMHWGHAVSQDLLHWTHLPIALFPQDALFGKSDWKGGAFSGSALIDEQGIELFFTRTLSPVIRDARSTEYQAAALIRDGFSVENERTIIPSRPHNGVDYCFRDPKVLPVNGELGMLIACTENGVPSVLLYRRDPLGNWFRKGLFFQDQVDTSTFECANWIPDRSNPSRGSLLCALQFTVDQYARTSLTLCYSGFITDEDVFVSEGCRLYDFGTSAYAMQTIELPDRTLMFGWVHSPYGEFQEEGSVSNGCITLPREAEVRNGWLYTRPAREVAALEEETLYSGYGEHVVVPVPNGLYRMDLRFSADTDFCIVLAEAGGKWIGLTREADTLTLHDDYLPPEVSLFQKVEQVRSLSIFVDKSVVEIFVNDGAFVATKDYFFQPDTGGVTATFLNPAHVAEARVAQLNAVWNTVINGSDSHNK